MQIFLCFPVDYFETDGFIIREGIPKCFNNSMEQAQGHWERSCRACLGYAISARTFLMAKSFVAQKNVRHAQIIVHIQS